MPAVTSNYQSMMNFYGKKPTEKKGRFVQSAVGDAKKECKFSKQLKDLSAMDKELRQLQIDQKKSKKTIQKIKVTRNPVNKVINADLVSSDSGSSDPLKIGLKACKGESGFFNPAKAFHALNDIVK